MNKYLTIINYRTLISITIATICLFLAYRFDIYYNIDLTLLSIAIIFPLVFNIRSSFRRREKAIEHLSQFRSALKTVYYFFMSSTELTEGDKQEISDILLDVSNKTINHLTSNGKDIKGLDDSLQQIFVFITNKKKLIPNRSQDKIYRFLNDIHEGIENLNAIHVHRTPISLKAYCKYFIYVFPLIYTPSTIFNIGIESPAWVTASIVIFSEFMLISLYNIQDQMEYPFDNIGLDDINLELFKLYR